MTKCVFNPFGAPFWSRISPLPTLFFRIFSEMVKMLKMKTGYKMGHHALKTSKNQQNHSNFLESQRL